MPTMATSSGSATGSQEAGPSCPAAASSAARCSSSPVAPSVTWACRAATVVVPVRRVAAWPSMNSPSAYCCGSPTRSSGAGAAAPRRSPLLAIRSRPRFSRSSSSHTARASLPPATSRCRVASKASAYGVAAQRVACPGAVCSRTVSVHSTAARWKPGSTAPAATASCVNRYAVPISTPIRAPRSASGAAAATAIAAERASWMPPANSTSRAAGSGHPRSSSICSSHSANEVRGPTWPPHSSPSNTNRRAPSARYRSSSPGEGTCRCVAVPAASSGAAWAGVPPAMIACGGRISATAASCSRRSSGGVKPRSPTPQGRSPSRSAVSASSLRTSAPSITASARYGIPPSAATASAKAAWSLTRVIGPWATGSGRSSGRVRTAAPRCPVTAARTAWSTPPVVRYRAASRAAEAPSCPTGSSWVRRSRAPSSAAAGPSGGVRSGRAYTRCPSCSRVSEPSIARSAAATSAGSAASPSAVRASCTSTSTPAAPPATAAAAVCGPIPPRARTGTPSPGPASSCWSSTKVVAPPTRPPASCPLATSATAPAATAIRASARPVTSAQARRRPPSAQAAICSGVCSARSATSTVSTSGGRSSGPSGHPAGTRTP